MVLLVILFYNLLQDFLFIADKLKINFVQYFIKGNGKYLNTHRVEINPPLWFHIYLIHGGMNMLGTILVHCLAGKFSEVLPDIKSVKGVKDAFGTLGRWDIVVKVDVPDLQAMDQLTLEVKSIKGVRDVETLMAETIG